MPELRLICTPDATSRAHSVSAPFRQRKQKSALGLLASIAARRRKFEAVNKLVHCPELLHAHQPAQEHFRLVLAVHDSVYRIADVRRKSGKGFLTGSREDMMP